MVNYYPEGYYPLDSRSSIFKTLNGVKEAMNTGKILEARAIVCNSNHDLIVDLGCIKGIIPRNECAIGISEGYTKDIAIISKVNKHVCFKVIDILDEEKFKPYAILSRRQVQLECMEDYIRKLTPGDIVKGKITHFESFGCFVDIGCGIISLLPIDAISISRISHPRDRFNIGQNIYCIIKSIGDDGKICLSHKELLGTWEENATLFSSGETVGGIVRSIEDYGIFVELTPNLAGLAELKDNVHIGQQTSVYIKSLIPEKMKIKLIIVDSFDDNSQEKSNINYFINSGHLDNFIYSPYESQKIIETIF